MSENGDVMLGGGSGSSEEDEQGSETLDFGSNPNDPPLPSHGMFSDASQVASANDSDEDEQIDHFFQPEDRMMIAEEDSSGDEEEHKETERHRQGSETHDTKKEAYYGLRRFQRGDWYLSGPSMLKKDVPEVKLQFNNISYRVPNLLTNIMGCIPFVDASGTGGKELVQNVTGTVQPGSVLAIIGPSGAGKSTLLNILSGQVVRGVFGTVAVNDIPLNNRRKIASKLGAGVIAYVHQDDAMFPMLTVEQTLMYAALLRLPTTMSWSKKLERVRYVMNVLGLEHVKDSPIGDQLHPVLSGGEKRRVTIGIEFVQNPSLIFLDEPTSGLDSVAALGIVEGIANMAHQGGRTVVLSIHQPTVEMFNKFDQVLVLATGKTVYYGTPQGLGPYCTKLGYDIPANTNPAEFMLDIIKYYQERKLQHMLFTFYVQYGPAEEETEREVQPTVDVKPSLLQRFDHCIGGDKYATTFPEQVAYLGHRNIMTILQDPHVFIVRCIVMIILTFCVGSLFWDTDECDYLIVGGFIIIAVAILFFNSLESIPIFVKERAVFEREYRHHAYRASSYVVASQIINLPFLVVLALLFGIPCYWMAGLRASFVAFGYWLMIMFLTLVAAQNLMMWLAMMFPEAQLANSIATAILALWLFFGGFFITLNDIPDYWVWFHYTSVFKYPFEGLILNEYPDDDTDCDCACAPNPFAPNELDCDQGRDFVEDYWDIKITNRWADLAIIIGFALVFRLLAYITLRIRYRKD